MAQALASFQGALIYVDAMILQAFLDSQSPWHDSSRDLFRRAVRPVNRIRLVTATLALDEMFFVLLEQLVARPPYGVRRSRGRFLGTHPEIVRQLMVPLETPVRGLLRMLSLEPVLPEDITAMRREMAATGRLPRDAIHLSVMRRLGITAIASDDDDFDGYPDIALFKP
jgi:predicted nucleic acid-binding protein